MKPPGKTFQRTVYILGAGFSKEANIPLQSEILEAIRNLNLSDAPPSLVNRYLNSWSQASSFLDSIFGPKEDPPLEDVFTLLDETISRRQYCRGYSWYDLETVNKALSEVILYLFQLIQQEKNKTSHEFYNILAAFLLEETLKSKQQTPPCSIISLNWDCVLDNAIDLCIAKCPKVNVAIDYACYCTAIPEISRYAFLQHGEHSDIHKIKVMKLHGSTNWLLCPNCGRLYVGLGAQGDTWVNYILGASCPQCANILSSSENHKLKPPVLEPVLITPTFIKKIENPHIRMVWHNAYINLCEAEKVVFIGYSLREADYRLRTLFKRAIGPNTNIEVVLAPADKPKGKSKEKQTDGVTGRYRKFFSSSDTIFYYNGMKEYFKEKIGPANFKTRIKKLQRLTK